MNENLVERFKSHAKTFTPIYSVFRTSGKGDYYLLYNGRSATEAAKAYSCECLNPNAIGVEVRVDGWKVQI